VVLVLTFLPFVSNGESVHPPWSCQTVLPRTYQPEIITIIIMEKK
jgi:hypothetical protein